VRRGWRLGVTLILFAGAGAILYMAPPVKGAVSPVSLYALPVMLGAWSGTDGVPDEILPPDPNEKLSVRRSYRHGHQVAWVSVALFVGQHDEARRASIDKIYPQRNVSLIEPVSLTVSLNTSAPMPITLPGVIVHQDSRRLLVVYWHQIGSVAYGNEYRFRFALMRDLIFTRRGDALLVRIALPASVDRPVHEDLLTARELALPLYAAIVQEISR